MVGGNEHDAGKFAVGSGHGLERKGFHAGDFTELLFKFPDYLKRSLRIPPRPAQLGHERVQAGEPGQRCCVFREFGVIFHGAGAERVEVAVYRVIEAGKPGEMAYHIQFGKFGQARSLLAEQGGGQHVGGPFGGLAGYNPNAAGAGLFKQRFHYMPPRSSEAIISQRMPICSRLCFSVQARSSTLSMPL